jgi:hypothetical protein
VWFVWCLGAFLWRAYEEGAEIGRVDERGTRGGGVHFWGVGVEREGCYMYVNNRYETDAAAIGCLAALPA